MVCVKCDVEKWPVRGGYDDDGDDGDDGDGDDGGDNDSYFGHLKVWSVVSLNIFNANCHLQRPHYYSMMKIQMTRTDPLFLVELGILIVGWTTS